MNSENPKNGKQEVIPKKHLQRGEVCSIDEWLEFCERDIESGSGRASVEKYDIKPKAVAASEGYTHILSLPRENDVELKRLDLLWFARPKYYEFIDTLARRHGIDCKHTDDQYYAFRLRDDAERLSQLLSEAQQSGSLRFEVVEGEIVNDTKSLPKS